MATKTYDEYLADQLAASKKQTDEYAARRKTRAEEAARVSDAFYDAAIETSRKDHEASAKQTEDSYRSVYDANAVNELVMRREIQEAIANMGLTDSGLNATQQTAVSLQRGRADSEATRQKQAAVDAIIRELNSRRAELEAQKTSAAAGIYAQADADILNLRINADTDARQNAASLYAADREAEATRYAAEQEAATKQAQMLLDAQKAQADERVKMLELGYQWDEEKQTYIKQPSDAGATGQLTNDQIKLAFDYMDRTGADYTTAVKELFGTSATGIPDITDTSVEDTWRDGIKPTVLTPAIIAFEATLHPEDQHDAVMRNMYGSYNQYRAQMLKTSGLSQDEMIALIQKWGLTESDFKAKN